MMTNDQIAALGEGLKSLGDGLYIRVRGRVRRFLERRKEGGRTVWTPIGYHPGITVAEAVEKASVIREARTAPKVVRVISRDVQQELLTIADVARWAGCDEAVINNAISSGALVVVSINQVFQTGDSADRIPVWAVREWLASMPITAPPTHPGMAKQHRAKVKQWASMALADGPQSLPDWDQVRPRPPPSVPPTHIDASTPWPASPPRRATLTVTRSPDERHPDPDDNQADADPASSSSLS
jgi:hypothetical protein